MDINSPIFLVHYFRFNYSTTVDKTINNKTNTEADDEELENKPIVYTKSPAASWQAKYSLAGRAPSVDRPPFEATIIMCSIFVFLVYFCILREENDFDKNMKKGLYEMVPGLEEIDLQTALNNQNLSDADRTLIEQRLKELKGN